MRPLLLGKPVNHSRRRAHIAARLSRPTFVQRGIALTALTILHAAAFAGPALGQYPGELAGRVSDAVTGEPVENALIEVVGAGLFAYSDGGGEFRIRGLEPGRQTVRVSRIGYEPYEREVEIRNGDATRLIISLGVRPVAVEGIDVEARVLPDPSREVITRTAIEASGELTAAGMLQGLAGVVVQRRGPGAPQTVSIRGSSADQVLVLLDGAPINDPTTGVADLSTIPTSQIESITVLRGSQSAAYGPGAAAGAVLIASRATAPALNLAVETGSLGYWSGAAQTSGKVIGLDWSAGGQARRAEGAFDYDRPTELGGGRAVRSNADFREASGFAAAAGNAAGGELRLRAGFTRLARGIPGPSYSPTTAAREGLMRWRGQAGWERRAGRARAAAQLYGLFQRAEFADPSPPNGTPYDDKSDALTTGGRLTSELEFGGALRSLWGGIELRRQDYQSTALRDAPPARFDFGVSAGGQLSPSAFSPTRLTGALRIDRDDLSGDWYLTHELSLAAVLGPATVHASHSSSYSPPTFGDQFFRAGVAVAPNPDLRAERVPSDFSLGASIAGSITDFASGSLSLQGYLADVKDMIIWAPDFRFVWSPRNFDVKRRGLELQGQLQLPDRHVELEATYSLTRATYDRPGDDDVQVIYRPRHSGSFGIAWRPGRWDLRASASFVGTRYPVPAPLNALDPYWTWNLRIRRDFDAAGWRLTPTLAIDRLFDNRQSLIYGYPEPGRVIRFEVAAQPL